MLLLIDNYDSFSYNLVQMFGSLNPDIRVVRNDAVTVEEIRRMHPSHVVLSPGPGYPSQAGICQEAVRELTGEVPILGVCLGHQVIGHAFGGKVCKGQTPMHGKITALRHDNSGLFWGLPSSFAVTRYHSLVVSSQQLPACFLVNAWSEDGVIMGMQHRTMPIYSVQFHPEAVLTQFGHELLLNFHKICERRNRSHAAYAGV